MKKKVTEKQFFKFLPKYQQLLEAAPKRFGVDGAYQQALYLSAMEFASKDPKEYVFNYEAIPPLWLSQDKEFCQLFCQLTPRKEHKRAVALMPYKKSNLLKMVQSDPKLVEQVPVDLFFDEKWVAYVSVFVEPRILACIPAEAHLRHELLEAIEKEISKADSDPLWAVRKKWVMYLMPNNPLPEMQLRGEDSVAQAFIRMQKARCFNERVKTHPQGLSEII